LLFARLATVAVVTITTDLPNVVLVMAQEKPERSRNVMARKPKIDPAIAAAVDMYGEYKNLTKTVNNLKKEALAVFEACPANMWESATGIVTCVKGEQFRVDMEKVKLLIGADVYESLKAPIQTNTYVYVKKNLT
jgi:hypothetical protein